MAHRILVVDDEPNILMTLQFILEEAGFEVATASDGVKALAVAREMRPSLVILDIAMPVKDGFEVCRELKEEENAPRVLMLTARGLAIDRKKGFEVGADAFMAKPFQMSALLKAIRETLGDG